MARLIHYKVKTKYVTTDTQDSTDFNEMIGGDGPLAGKALELLYRKLSKKHGCENGCIVICNVMDIVEPMSESDYTGIVEAVGPVS